MQIQKYFQFVVAILKDGFAVNSNSRPICLGSVYFTSLKYAITVYIAGMWTTDFNVFYMLSLFCCGNLDNMQGRS